MDGKNENSRIKITNQSTSHELNRLDDVNLRLHTSFEASSGLIMNTKMREKDEEHL